MMKHDIRASTSGLYGVINTIITKDLKDFTVYDISRECNISDKAASRILSCIVKLNILERQASEEKCRGYKRKCVYNIKDENARILINSLSL